LCHKGNLKAIVEDEDYRLPSIASYVFYLSEVEAAYPQPPGVAERCRLQTG
jgi:hypothetical protein